MFYHARVTIKPERAKESSKIAFEADMNRDDLLTKLALPFVQGKQFFCGGVVVHPSKVAEVKFNVTQQTSAELLPMLRAKRANSGVISASPVVWGVIWDGRDITREILDEAGNQPTRKVLIEHDEPSSISDRVFVVHGRDSQAVDQTELLIRRFGLTPIILREAPNAGRTVIEKFEAHSDVGFAIVLLTPDDVGGLPTAELRPRARQNVIWEWGYLVSKLGRDRVVCLYKGDVEMPSDLHGLMTIHIGDDVRTSSEEIRRELNAAGYHIT